MFFRFSLVKSLNITIKEVSNKSFINFTGFSFDVFKDLYKNEKWVLAPMVGISVFDLYLFAESSKITSVLTRNNLLEGFCKNELFFFKPGIEIKRKFQIGSVPIGVGVNCYYQFELGNGKWGNFNGKYYDSFATSKISGLALFLNSTIYF